MRKEQPLQDVLHSKIYGINAILQGINCREENNIQTTGNYGILR
ncbi:MAG: hypothetical protein SVV67_04210 [Bacillota bacterium]|nr:hypothetical protein [Bacillota bacterium]